MEQGLIIYPLSTMYIFIVLYWGNYGNKDAVWSILELN